MDPVVHIRSAQPADVETLFGFVCELADYEKLRHEVTGSPAALHEHLFGSRPVAEALLATVEEQPVGMLVFYTTFSTFLTKPGIYVEDLYVQPAHRQRGIGKSLLVRVAQIALERGYGQLDWKVLDWNQPAIEFYQRLGAEHLPQWIPNHVSGDALVALASMA